MNTEQLRADFEAWYEQEFEPLHGPLVRDEHNYPRSYENVDHALMWEAYQAGRAALQSQTRNDMTLFCDLKTDEEKSAFFLSGRGYETGVIAQAIQNDVAMAYHRCAEYKKELEVLQSQDREDAERLDWVDMQNARFKMGMAIGFAPVGNMSIKQIVMGGKQIREAIDHARRIEGEVE